MYFSKSRMKLSIRSLLAFVTQIWKYLQSSSVVENESRTVLSNPAWEVSVETVGIHSDVSKDLGIPKARQTKKDISKYLTENCKNFPFQVNRSSYLSSSQGKKDKRQLSGHHPSNSGGKQCCLQKIINKEWKRNSLKKNLLTDGTALYRDEKWMFC